MRPINPIRRFIKQYSGQVLAASIVALLSIGTFSGSQVFENAYRSTVASYTASTAAFRVLQLEANSATAELTEQISRAEKLRDTDESMELADISAARDARSALDIASSELGDDYKLLAAGPSVLPWKTATTVSQVSALSGGLKPLIAAAIEHRKTLDDVASKAEELLATPVDSPVAEESETPRATTNGVQIGSGNGGTTNTAPVGAPAPVKPSGPAQYSVHVGATADASNQTSMQAAIDAGGQVAINFARLNMTFIAAHNFNDATALSLKTGDLVTFSGAVSGTWRVTSSIDIANGSSSEPVKTLGVSMVMQTCYWESTLSRIVGLVPA